MATGTGVAQTNGHVPKSALPKHILEYEKLVKLRDEVLAGTHPRVKLTKQVNEQNVAQNAAAAPTPSVPSFPLFQHTNGLPPKPVTTQSLQAESIAPSSRPAPISLPTKPQKSVPPPKPAFTSSGIDPVLLTKSDVLVKAEFRQKRQRLERTLEEQIHQKRLIKQAAHDQDLLLDFDINEVLTKAHDLVKPYKAVSHPEQNAASPSSDSFDENTFYSSQVNEFTSEEADDSPRDKQQDVGSSGRISHDQSNGGRVGSPGFRMPSSKIDKGKAPANPITRIAELEEELRRLKAANDGLSSSNPPTLPVVQRSDDDDAPYSPPDVEAPIPQISARDHTVSRQVVDVREPRYQVPHQRSREYVPEDRYERSPLPDNMRIVRNHITSPAAPQPSRVSPLAVNKEPRAYGEDPHSRRDSGQFQTHGVEHNPMELEESRRVRQDPGPASGARKRRRGSDSRERMRRVHARRDTASPEIRIKQEPTSPPFSLRPVAPQYATYGAPQPEERPVYIRDEPNGFVDSDRVVYLPPRTQRQDSGVLSRMSPLPAATQRATSQTVPRYRQEPDLRRVVSTRHLRPPSPTEHYQPSSPRARNYTQDGFPVDREPERNPRASVQPRMTTDRDYRRVSTPDVVPPMDRLHTERAPIAMAPPPRRIVVDQYGNRFMEAADHYHPPEPIRPTDDASRRYERFTEPSSEIRDGGYHAIAPPSTRAISPVPPRYEYTAPRTMQVLDRATGRIVEGREYISHEPRPEPAAFVESPRRERFPVATEAREPPRIQSVRPVESAYEVPYDRSTRIQSLHPEQERYIRAPEGGGPISRQASIRPEALVTRPSAYAMEERPRYQFPQEVEERHYVRGGQQQGRYVFMDDRDGPR